MTETTCFPGDVVVADPQHNFFLGDGVYRDVNGCIRASLLGTCVRKERDETTEISVVSSSSSKSAIERIITVGDVVHAQIVKLSLNQAQADIFAVGDVSLTSSTRGLIRREDMKLREVHSLVMRDCFRPGDIIRAQVISLGDSRQYYLSTAVEEFGVVYATSDVDNSLLQPISPNEMQNVNTQHKELRKVAIL